MKTGCIVKRRHRAMAYYTCVIVSEQLHNIYIILVNVTKDISTKQQGGIISNNLSNFYLIAPKIQICTVPLTVFCLFLKYHEK